MSAFIKTLSDLVALFLQALRLSVVMPAAVFVGLNLGFVAPMFRDTAVVRQLGLDELDLPLGILLLAVVLLVAYALSVLNIPIIRLFEGYPLLLIWPFTRLQLSYKRRVVYLREQINKYADETQPEADATGRSGDARPKKTLTRQERNQFRNLYNQELSFRYPHHQTWRILPTQLGNVIAAAEEFPGHLYGLDSVTFWPFLNPILSERGYATFVEREKSSLDFLLNMAVVTLVFGAEVIYARWLLGSFTWPSSAAIATVSIALAYVFYLISIQGALSWGYTIRVAYVLHRDELRRRLGLGKPTGIYEERVLWRWASRFYRDHDITPGPYIFDYRSDEREESPSTK